MTNSNGSGDQIDGIIYQALDFALNKCCSKLKRGSKTFINCQTEVVANSSMLLEDILKDEAHVVFPVQSDTDMYKGYVPFLKILDSPGVVLIQRTDGYQLWGAKNILLWNAVSGCWQIVLLTLLLSFVAGMCVWVMVRYQVI